MNEIAILTYWGIPNYGAWTQAYALTNYIRNCLNRDCVQIAYIEKSHFDKYYESNQRLQNAFNYSWKEIPHITIKSPDDFERTKLDILITGADSIWSFEEDRINRDLHLMGIGVDAKKKVGYAPSMGRLPYSELTNEMIEGLKEYSCINVRDKYTFDCLKAVGIETGEIVLDPALLWEFGTDNRVKYPIYRDYVAVYGNNWTQDYIEYVTQYADNHGLKTISIGYVNDWCDISLKMIELRCLEWIGMIGGADCVFTSTFHGLMVGLNYSQKVFFNQVNEVKNRSESLRKNLNPDSICDDQSFVFLPEQYSEELRVLKNESERILRGAING